MEDADSRGIMFTLVPKPIPYPMASSVGKAVEELPALARAEGLLKEPFLPRPSVSVALPCFFEIREPYTEFLTGIQLHFSGPGKKEPGLYTAGIDGAGTAERCDTPEGGTTAFHVTVRETADSTSVLPVVLQWTAEMIILRFQATVPLGDHPRQFVSDALVQVAARVTKLISQQFPGRRLPPQWGKLTEFWTKNG